MLEKIYVVTDLGPGDGGKGGVVHALAQKPEVSIVIKRGGAQGSHGVRTSSGDSFNFSQWGCGTLNAIPTYLSDQMIISPIGLENESEALKKLGIYNPYALLSINPMCICATPYHRISSRLEELLLGESPRGTVGTGVGKAYRSFKELGDIATIRAYELTDPSKPYRAKLRYQRDYYREKYRNITTDSGLSSDAEYFKKNLDLLYDDDFLPYIENRFEDVSKNINLRELEKVIKEETGTAIIECSHGILTDAELGFKPHVSAIRTLPIFTCNMLKDAGFNGEIKNLAVHRAYEIRHGAGPMPTYDPDFTSKMLPGSHKDENRWQGIIRAGALDFNHLCYAVNCCKDTPFDGIAITWFDQILATGRDWLLCKDYANPLEHIRIKQPIHKQELFELVNNIINEAIGVPLKMLSIGSTEIDKIYSEKL